MYTSMLKNYVNGCHGNRAFFIVQTSFSLRTNILCIWGQTCVNQHKLLTSSDGATKSQRGNTTLKKKNDRRSFVFKLFSLCGVCYHRIGQDRTGSDIITGSDLNFPFITTFTCFHLNISCHIIIQNMSSA